MEEHARSSGLSRFGVLVVGGKLHSGRQAGFARRLESRFKDAELVVDDTGEYSRAHAHEIVWRNIQGQPEGKPCLRYIFCTNDEMALGAVDALRTAGAGNDDSVVVVGVDGTPEARALIESQTTPLRATVVQDSCSIAETTVDMLVRMTCGDTVKTCTYLEPGIYKASAKRWQAGPIPRG